MEKITPRMKFAIALFAAVFLIVAAVSVCSASVKQNNEDIMIGGIAVDYVFPEYNELIAESDLIVVAIVKDKKGVWDTKDGKKPLTVNLFNMKDEKRPIVLRYPHAGINTEYTFEAEEVLKGEATIFKGRTRGGCADGYRIDTSGVPSFEPGERVLLFLKTNTDEDGNLISWYHIGLPDAFPLEETIVYQSEWEILTSVMEGHHTNDYYGDLTIEQLRIDVAANAAANSENQNNADMQIWDGMYISWHIID
jgi:hypothetical protein